MNDWIRLMISSSPISLPKIFVAPPTFAPELVLMTSMRVCTFKILMEQRAVICFLTLKSLRASALPAKLKSSYEQEELAIFTAKKWRKRFAEGRTSQYDDSRCEKPLINELTEAISSVLKERPCLLCKVLCRHFRIAKGTCL
jgi:hypothetical protein